jgi:hypothetical protein
MQYRDGYVEQGIEQTLRMAPEPDAVTTIVPAVAEFPTIGGRDRHVTAFSVGSSSQDLPTPSFPANTIWKLIS